MNLSFGIIFGILVTTVTCQRKVAEDYKFKCAAADNKGDFLTLFDKLKFMTADVQPEIFKYDSVRKVIERTIDIIKRLSESYNEQAYKDLEKYLCDTFHIDIKFLLENFISSQTDLYEAFKSKKPEEIPDKENLDNFQKMLNTLLVTKEKNVKMTKVLTEQFIADPKLAEAFDLIESPEFRKFFGYFMELPLPGQFVDEIRDLGIDAIYEMYPFWFATTYWERTNGADSLRGVTNIILLGVSILLCSQKFLMKLF